MKEEDKQRWEDAIRRKQAEKRAKAEADALLLAEREPGDFERSGERDEREGSPFRDRGG